jgi:hypothetical protein
MTTLWWFRRIHIMGAGIDEHESAIVATATPHPGQRATSISQQAVLLNDQYFRKFIVYKLLELPGATNKIIRMRR